MKNKESVTKAGVGKEKITAKNSEETEGNEDRRKRARNVTKYMQRAD
ncbi:hypothetical protein PEC302110_34290 [Pectobacterium araliae]|uniref:Uncharacterized protein n=1 Tax=Pectobacterium araliae TaxID=3073862 RepID=A0AAN0KCC8_9GAMM|nr:hypothetical protein PEC302110_34290 [Pectobacterium sp. MAFF 302110]